MLTAQRALISVSNKEGLAELGRGLEALGIEILSTGGTKRHLEEAGVKVMGVAEATGSPEILGGRVKTLHPKVHGGILADRSQASHLAELRAQEIVPIDLVVVNLYPFEETIAKEETTFEEAIEMIDIGGPCMLRAAAKNHAGVVVVVRPERYSQVLEELQANDRTVSAELRRELALEAFRHTQAYDAAIVDWMASEGDEKSEVDAALPPRRRIELVREMVPRYGENPHQQSAVYRTVGGAGLLGGFEQLQGKELSWNNLLDADAARRLVGLFDEPTVVIVKHNNPCGVGTGSDLVEAYERALACDPVSAFGSIVAVNGAVSEELTVAMKDLFVEVLVAPEIDAAARGRTAKKKNLRVLECPLPKRLEAELRSIDGGFLAQTPDVEREDASAWEVRTKAQPSNEQLLALDFNWRVSRHVKSNAIVLGNAVQTVGIGAGQMSRLDSCRLAIQKAQLPVAGTVAASDAFFPFRDGVDVLIEAGVSAIAQPGGSKRDDDAVAACDEHGVAMVFTGRRHFKH